MSQPTYLTSGSRVCVVGAGPAGSFFAIELLRRARALGLSLAVDIYDGKNFAKKGAPGCNMCAGAIGHNLIEEIEHATTAIPPRVIHYELEGYAVHYQDASARLANERGRKIYGVYRGAGPVSTESPDGARSFDQFLLDEAVKLGARHVPLNVQDIDVPATLGERPVLHTGDGAREEFDLVVGAFGVNSQLSQRLTYGYQPPPTWKSCVIEARVPREFQKEKLGDLIHFFVLKQPDVRYVALIPKGEHVTVTAIGESVDVISTERLLRESYMRDYLPADWKLDCHCHPRVAVGAARLPYSDRFVIVGDASDSRYLKNGVESALVTARLAADCVINHGVTAEDFEEHFWRACARVFGRDNVYGRALFKIYDRVFPHPLVAPVYFAVLHAERMMGKQHALLSDALLAAFTGDQPYKRILLRALHPRLAARMASHAGSLVFDEVRTRITRAERRRLHSDANEIELRAPTTEEPALMVSRSEFDELLLERARAEGAQVSGDRVTGLEFHPENLEH